MKKKLKEQRPKTKSRFRRYQEPLEPAPYHPVKQRSCACPGCDQPGHYRAPQSRDRLNEYYWFCLDHVREYNRQWDFLRGLSPEEIESCIRRATVWDRPSWPLGEWQKREKELRDSIKRAFFSGEGDEAEPANGNAVSSPALGEREALSALGLAPPVAFATVKARYRDLVKRHHPDANGGSPEAEEKLKSINHAFTTLKAIYGTEEKA